MNEDTLTDWAAWSRASVALMNERNQNWINTFQVASVPYHWHLDPPVLEFKRASDYVRAVLCCIGGVSLREGTFLWSWANDAIPACAKQGIERVRTFGQHHGLPLLTSASWRGSRPEGLEMLAISGRILDAQGAWVAPAEDVTLFFALSSFEVVGTSEFENTTGRPRTGESS
jgi:hypothetical protein